ncbi:MAG: hypothetical protein J6U53_03270 [Tidjanibacter sp.]|nr:hypothetical protein [Tidjanibacter sp.]
MKKSIINILWGAMLSVALLVVGCETPEEVITPNFPEPITATVMAGDKYEFTITPNTQWTLKIPTEANTHFCFLKGASELYTLRGNAGEHKITVQISDNEEFDTNRVCAIEMTMEGETKVILTLTRSSKERTLAIYNCEFDTEEETFKTETVDGDIVWVYSPTAAEKIDWVWCNEQWMQRILVDANFDWSLSANTPDWLLCNATSGKAGRTELFLRINRENLPLEDVVCNIEFCDKKDKNGDGAIDENDIIVVGSYSTEMEGCKDVCEVNLASSLVFNANGEYYQASTDYYGGEAYGSISSPMGAEIFAVTESAEGVYTTDGAEWILLSVSDFPTEAAANKGVWERSITIATEPFVSINARKGAIIALPKSVAEAGEANYADYIVATITQEGIEIVDGDAPIAPYDEDILSGYSSKWEALEAGTWPWNGEWANIPYAYKFTYRDNSSGSEIIISKPFDHYEIYGYNGFEGGAYEDLNTCWLTIESRELTDLEGNKVENAYYIRSRLGESIDENGKTKYENPKAGPDGSNRAVIVFYDTNNNAYAMILFVLDPEFSPFESVEGNVGFADPESAELNGTTLVELKNGDKYFEAELHFMGTKQYLLTLNNSTSVDLTIPEHSTNWAYQNWITVKSNNTKVTITIKPSNLPGYNPSFPSTWPDDVIAAGVYKGIVSFYETASSNIPFVQLHIIYNTVKE